jgi:selenocysteine-specific elongation factor
VTASVPSSHRVVTLAGHVDHGKSTLLRALTGMEPDRLPEERLRGRTIELGFLWADLAPGGPRVAFVDVPGHARLVGTMIAGSGVSPAALLVVAADDGPSVQTREHLDILDLLGVPGSVVAITKVDRVDEDRVREVEEGVRTLVAGTTFASATTVRVSAPDGRGVDRLRSELRGSLARLSEPVADRAARLWTDRAFSIDGAGTVVTGTLADGPLRRGDTVTVQPGGARARIRRLQQLGAEVESAGPGTRVAVNLVGVDVTAVRRGDVLVAGEPGPLTSVIDAWVRLLPGEAIEGVVGLRLHCGTAVRSCRVRPLLDAAGGQREGASHVAVRIRLGDPLPVRVGDRFILREPGRGRTVGGGIVVDPAAPVRLAGAARRGRVGALRDAAAALQVATDLDAVRAAWLTLPPGLRTVSELEGWTGGPLPDLPTASDPGGSVAVRIGGWVAAATTVRRLMAELVEAASAGRDVHGTVAALSVMGVPAEAGHALVDHARRAGLVGLDGDALVLPASQDARGEARRRRMDALVERFVAAALDPPDLLTVARELDVEHLERQALLASGALVRCGDLTLAGHTVDAAVEVLRTLQVESGPFTASQARLALGTTRRVLIPLLEHLVRTGRSRFDGQQHRIVER